MLNCRSCCLVHWSRV